MGHSLCYPLDRREVTGMIYCCQSKCCHFLFYGSIHESTCPDCGQKRIRPATRAERAAYFRQRAEAHAPARRSG